jgi:hypothetical protein
MTNEPHACPYACRACAGSPCTGRRWQPRHRRFAQDTIATLNDPRVISPRVPGNTAETRRWNMRLVSWSPKPAQFDSARGLTFINSDLAFRGKRRLPGQLQRLHDLGRERTRAVRRCSAPCLCATDQGDPSIYGNLLFISAESPRSRNDCGTQGVEDGADRMRGVRIFDVSDPRSPRLVKNVQTCRGSHTHTIVPHPTDRQRDLHLRRRLVVGARRLRDAGVLVRHGRREPEHGAVPRRHHPRPAQQPEQAPSSAMRACSRTCRARPAAPVSPRTRPQRTSRGGPSGCHDLTSYPAR